jgi:hypothetical protein
MTAVLTSFIADIDFVLEEHGSAYRKKGLRKRVIEPFFWLMHGLGIETSRMDLPRKPIFDALWDLLEVEKRHRPTSANIDAIARELKSDGPKAETTQKKKKGVLPFVASD